MCSRHTCFRLDFLDPARLIKKEVPYPLICVLFTTEPEVTESSQCSKGNKKIRNVIPRVPGEYRPYGSRGSLRISQICVVMFTGMYDGYDWPFLQYM